MTGVLVSTRSYFAQEIEGTGPAIENLLGRLKADTRHTELTVLKSAPISLRRYIGWSLAYVGMSTSVEAKVAAVSSHATGNRVDKIDELAKLLFEFARTDAIR